MRVFRLILTAAILLLILAPLSHSQNISYTGSTLWSGVNDVKISGHYAYCAFFNGLMILDISNPASPAFVSQLYIGGDWNNYALRDGQKLSIQGNYVYFAADYLGLKIIDVSHPANPVLVGEYVPATYVSGVFAQGNYAYVTSSTLHIVDISNPAQPTLVSNCSLSGGTPRDVVVVGNYAYLASGGGGLKIVDISSPESPQLIGTYNGEASYAIDIQIVGNYAYLAYGYSGLVIVDITDPTNPTFVGRWSNYPNVWVDGVFINGNLAYIETDSGLGIFDISNPTNPSQVGGLGGYWGLDVYVLGNYAYVAALTSGFQVVNISNPASPTLFATYTVPAGILDAFIQGNYAYVATGQTGLKIVDITNPQNMPVVGNWVGPDFFDQPSSSFVSGNYAYLGTNSWIKIIDISNPATPIAVGSYDIPDAPYDIYIVDPYAYIVTGTNYGPGFYVMDISSPANPIQIGQYNLPNAGLNLQIIDNYAYIACGWFYILDISNPTTPTFVGRYHPIEGETGGVCISGEYAYLANSGRLEIVDISNRAHPVMIASCPTMASTTTVEVRGNYALVGESRDSDFEQQGLQIFDVTDKTNPVLFDELKTPGDANSVFTCGDNQIYLADGYSLMLLQFDMTGIDESLLPNSFTLYQNYPNPFNAQTTISYNLPKTEQVTLSIYNIMGQKIATLFDGLQAVGKHEFIWDADAVSSGVYFANLKAGEKTESIKMVLLK